MVITALILDSTPSMERFNQAKHQVRLEATRRAKLDEASTVDGVRYEKVRQAMEEGTWDLSKQVEEAIAGANREEKREELAFGEGTGRARRFLSQAQELVAGGYTGQAPVSASPAQKLALENQLLAASQKVVVAMQEAAGTQRSLEASKGELGMIIKARDAFALHVESSSSYHDDITGEEDPAAHLERRKTELRHHQMAVKRGEEEAARSLALHEEARESIARLEGENMELLREHISMSAALQEAVGTSRSKPAWLAGEGNTAIPSPPQAAARRAAGLGATVCHTFPALWASTSNLSHVMQSPARGEGRQDGATPHEEAANKDNTLPRTAGARLRAQLMGSGSPSAANRPGGDPPIPSPPSLIRSIIPAAHQLPAGRALLSYTIDGAVTIRDHATGEVLTSFSACPLDEPTVCVPGVAGEVLRGDGFGRLRSVRVEQGGQGSLCPAVSLEKRHQGVSAALCDSDHIYVGGSGGSVVGSTKHRESIAFHPPHRGPVNAMLVAADVLFTAGEDGTVVAWDVKTHERLLTMAAMSPKGQHALVEGTPEPIQSLALISDVLYAGTRQGRVHTFKGMLSVVLHDLGPTVGAPGSVWSIPDGSAVTALLASAPQFTLYVCGSAGYLAAWDCRQHIEIARFRGHGSSISVTCVVHSDVRGGLLFSGDEGGGVVCHSLSTQQVERVFAPSEEHPSTGGVAMVLFM